MEMNQTNLEQLYAHYHYILDNYKIKRLGRGRKPRLIEYCEAIHGVARVILTMQFHKPKEEFEVYKKEARNASVNVSLDEEKLLADLKLTSSFIDIYQANPELNNKPIPTQPILAFETQRTAAFKTAKPGDEFFPEDLISQFKAEIEESIISLTQMIEKKKLKQELESAAAPQEKRGRGRPRKIKTEAEQVKRPRGRPRKVVQNPDIALQPKASYSTQQAPSYSQANENFYQAPQAPQASNNSPFKQSNPTSNNEMRLSNSNLVNTAHATYMQNGETQQNNYGPVVINDENTGLEVCGFCLEMLDIEASAGPGTYTDSYQNSERVFLSDYEYFRYLSGENPKNLKAIKVRGDSMEPILKSGQTCVVRLTNQFLTNGIYVFTYANVTYIKRLTCLEGNRILALSENPNYPAFIINEKESFTIHGKLVLALDYTRLS